MTRQMVRSRMVEAAGAGLAAYGGSESAMTQSESGGINIMAAQRGGSRSRRQPSQQAAGLWCRDRRLQRGGAGLTAGSMDGMQTSGAGQGAGSQNQSTSPYSWRCSEV